MRESEAANPVEEALRASEARLRTILDTAVDAFITINAQGIIESFNASAERMFGYSAREVIGKNVSVLMPPPFSLDHDQYLENYRRTGERHVIGLGRVVSGRRSDGTIFPIELAVGEAVIHGERIFTGVVRDITERQETEKALRDANSRLKQALEALEARGEELRSMSQQLWQATKLATVGELAAGIAHELNNPLATISLRIEAVLNSLPKDDAHRRPLEIIEGEIERMSHLVANLLQFSRRGKQQVSSLDLREELERTLELIHYQLRKRGIEVHRRVANVVPLVPADRQQLRQVFLNLLTNASDAMPQGGDLTLSVQPIHSEDDGSVVGVAVEVGDTGIGIAPENLPRIMEPFFTTKDESKGTGLGLAICKRIVQEHEGSMAISSNLGHGTTVRVTLPLANSLNSILWRDA